MELTFSPREFLDKTVALLRTPASFYKSVEKEKSWKEAFTYSIALSVIAAIFGVLEVTLLYPLFKNELSGIFSPDSKPEILQILPAFFVSAVIVVLLGFIWSGALHLWLRLCRVKGNYWNAYRTFTYSRAPMSLFGWIPYIGPLFSLYGLYLLVIGISVHYKLSRVRAFLLLIVPLFLLTVLQTVVYSLASQTLP